MLEVTWTSFPPAPGGAFGDSLPEAGEISADADLEGNAGEDLQEWVSVSARKIDIIDRIDRKREIEKETDREADRDRQIDI